MELTFEWDEAKGAANLRKHDVSFEEAKTVFNDPLLLTFPDSGHSIEEQRYISLGFSFKGLLLIVVHTERDDNIRIISCRKATIREQIVYERQEFTD
jgi:uncharacterized protein